MGTENIEPTDGKEDQGDALARSGRTLRSLIIEPFKQMKFGLYVIGISVAFVVVCAVLFISAFTEQYKHVMGIFQVVDPNLKWELVTNDIFYANAKRLIILFVAFIVILFYTVFHLTHRYYGPLVSIERFIDAMTAGDYHKRCRIRTKDELHDLVDKLNEMAAQLERRHGAKYRSSPSDPSDSSSGSSKTLSDAD